jgi:hypothetical protein
MAKGGGKHLKKGEPKLDGKNMAIGTIDDDSGHYWIIFQPCVACTGHDGTRQKAGTYYHAGYMFVDAYAIRIEARVGSKHSGGALCEFTKRAIHVDAVKLMLSIWDLDKHDIHWEYLRSKGVKRNIFWMPGDASWAESQQAKEIDELQARMGKAMRALGERTPWDGDWLGLEHEVYEVTKKNKAAIVKARLTVEKAEAQAAERRAERAAERAKTTAATKGVTA